MVQYSIRKPIKALWVDAFAKLAALRETDPTLLDLPGSVSVIFFVAQNEKTQNPCMVFEVLHSFWDLWYIFQQIFSFHLNEIYWSVSKTLYRICIIFCPDSGLHWAYIWEIFLSFDWDFSFSKSITEFSSYCEKIINTHHK